MVNLVEVMKGVLDKLTNGIPIKNGGTGATTAEEALANLGAMGKWELLWENASTSSAFAAQTISLDLSEYDFIYIRTVYRTGFGDGVSGIIRKGDGIFLSLAISGNLYRGFGMQNTGVIVYAGFAVNTYGTPTQDNSRIVPIQIYGIKNAIK